ncbi:hypothetical protein WMF27_41435 [Sorangium sp. So ce281]|uniref:hypothetical protein n=1 Tax=Sorangium sp. So ce281 TaxID=3133293 RepID=UPI003F5D8FAA
MTEALERGDIYFLYRPEVERELGDVEGMDDVQRLFAVLRPDDKDLYRLIVIGQKQLPDIHAPQGRARRSKGLRMDCGNRRATPLFAGEWV